MPGDYAEAAHIGGSSTRLSLISRRPFGSTRNTPWRIFPGNVDAAKGDYDEALSDFTEAIRLNPKLAEAFTELGDIEQGCLNEGLPTTPRPFGSTRRLPWRTTTVALPTIWTRP